MSARFQNFFLAGVVALLIALGAIGLVVAEVPIVRASTDRSADGSSVYVEYAPPDADRVVGAPAEITSVPGLPY